jgi:hypothetical protein
VTLAERIREIASRSVRAGAPPAAVSTGPGETLFIRSHSAQIWDAIAAEKHAPAKPANRETAPKKEQESGDGEYQYDGDDFTPCETCDGTGMVDGEICPDCAGSGDADYQVDDSDQDDDDDDPNKKRRDDADNQDDDD